MEIRSAVNGRGAAERRGGLAQRAIEAAAANAKAPATAARAAGSRRTPRPPSASNATNCRPKTKTARPTPRPASHPFQLTTDARPQPDAVRRMRSNRHAITRAARCQGPALRPAAGPDRQRRPRSRSARTRTSPPSTQGDTTCCPPNTAIGVATVYVYDPIRRQAARVTCRSSTSCPRRRTGPLRLRVPRRARRARHRSAHRQRLRASKSASRTPRRPRRLLEQPGDLLGRCPATPATTPRAAGSASVGRRRTKAQPNARMPSCKSRRPRTEGVPDAADLLRRPLESTVEGDSWPTGASFDWRRSNGA